jgi:hypothetical protein
LKRREQGSFLLFFLGVQIEDAFPEIMQADDSLMMQLVLFPLFVRPSFSCSQLLPAAPERHGNDECIMEGDHSSRMDAFSRHIQATVSFAAEMVCHYMSLL